MGDQPLHWLCHTGVIGLVSGIAREKIEVLRPEKRAALRDFWICGGEVLVSDLGLPDGDGWQLLRESREAGAFPYAIAMSGFGTFADVATSTEAGFRHHLVKPFEWDALKRLLGFALEECTH